MEKCEKCKCIFPDDEIEKYESMSGNVIFFCPKCVAMGFD